MRDSLEFGFDWKWKETTHCGGTFAQRRERLMGGALVASADTLALCCRGMLRFFESSTGNLLSEIAFPGTSFKAGSPSSMVLEGNSIFARYRNTLMCCDIRTRALVWSSNKVPSGHFCSMASFDGQLLISFGPALALFNKANGEITWKKAIQFSSTAHERSINAMMTCVKVDANMAVLSGLHCVLWVDAMSGELRASVSLGEIPKIRYALSDAHVIHWPAVSNVATSGSHSDNHSSTLRGAMVRLRFSVFNKFLIPMIPLALSVVGFIAYFPFLPGFTEASAVLNASNSERLALPDEEAATAWIGAKKQQRSKDEDIDSSTLFVYLAVDATIGVGLVTIDGYHVGYVSQGTSVAIRGIPVGDHILTILPIRGQKHRAVPKDLSISASITEYFTWNAEFEVIPGTREAQQSTSLEAAVSYREISGIASREDVSVLQAKSASNKAIIMKRGYYYMAPLKLEINGHPLPDVVMEGEGVRVEVDPGTVILDSYHNSPYVTAILDSDHKSHIGCPPKDGRWKTSRTLIVEAGKTYYLNVKPFSGLIYLHNKMVDCEPDMALGCHIKHVHLE